MGAEAMTKPRQFRLEDDTLRKIDELAAIIIDCVWLRVKKTEGSFFGLCTHAKPVLLIINTRSMVLTFNAYSLG